MNKHINLFRIKSKYLVVLLCMFSTLFVACKFDQNTSQPLTTDEMQSNQMQQANIGNIVLEYQVQGTGEPILFIHGSAIADTFLTLMPEPALSGYTLIRYRRRGYTGSSDVEDPFSMADQASDAAALLDYLNISKAHIVGHSYGGATALQLALDNPNKVHSLVLMEPPVTPPGDFPPPRGVVEGMGVYMSGDPEGAVDVFLKWALGDDWEADTELATPGGAAQAKDSAKTLFEVEVPALGQWQFTQVEASRIHHPALYIGGSLSVDELKAALPFLKQWIPQLEEHIIQDVNHGLHAKKPQEVALSIEKFLSENTF